MSFFDDIANAVRSVMFGPGDAVTSATNNIIYQVLCAGITLILFAMAAYTLFGKNGFKEPILRVIFAIVFIFIGAIFLDIFWMFGQIYH